MDTTIAVTVTSALVTTCAFIAWAGFRGYKRRTSQNAAGKELALLADACAVERQAKALLADAGEALALHDANAPFNMKQIGYGKGVLAAKVATGEARGAQRQLEWGEDFDGASIRLNLAKKAFVIAEEITVRAKIMAAVQGRTGYLHLREVPKVD